MKSDNLSKTATIYSVREGATYYRTADTNMLDPRCGLRRGDIPRRWRIVDEATEKTLAILSIVD